MEPSVSPKSIYFVNAWVDGFFIGGASIFGLLLTRYVSQGFGGFFVVAYYLAWVFNWPHFSATNYRFYQSRKHVERFPITAYFIPLLVGGAVAGSLYSPHGIAPYFIKLFTLWSPYHFAAQTFGIAMIYAKRSGFVVGRLERWALVGFIFGTYLTQVSRVDVHVGVQSLLSIEYPLLGLPSWIPKMTLAITYFSFLALAILTVRQRRQTGKWVAWPVFLAPATQYIWFMNGDLPAFQVFVPLFHSLQYLLIAWSMQKREQSLKWALINGGGGGMLFVGFPWLISLFGLPYSFVNAVFITGVQIHHFFVDGVIWKIRGGVSDLAQPMLDAKPIQKIGSVG